MKTGIDMKYNYLILTIAAFSLFSCAHEVVEAPETITIRAYQEGATETRTTLIDGGTQVYWEPFDEIKVFFNGSVARFVSQNTENADIAEFSGTLNVVVGVNEGASGNNTLWGLYPYRSDAASDGESVTTTLPTEQTGRVGSFAKGTNITLAKSNSFDLAFYNVTGGLRFSLTQEGVKEVIFQGQNDEDIAGKVKIAFVDGVPVVQEIIDGQKSITLTAPNGGTFETGKWYYIVALPGSLSNGFKVTFNTETQSATLKSSGIKTIKRGIFGSLENADGDLIFQDKGGDEPQTGNIVFADLAAKYACVAKYDTNGDGEVSYEEAEAATSFRGLFTDWKGVKNFDEIKYFKNVHSLSKVFEGCNKLVSITIPETITDLGTYAFSGCSSLSSVVLPSEITAIGNCTFQKCTSLCSINLPSNVTSIGDYAFDDCVSLTSIELPSLLETIGQSAFRYCCKLTTVNIPPGVTSIPESCFQECSSLNSISFPAGVTSVGANAFSGINMWKLELPSSISDLGGNCFSGIVCILLPSTSPITIQPNTFYGVKSIFVPSHLIDMYRAMTYWTNYSTLLHPIDSYKDKSEFVFVSSGAADMGVSVKWSACNLGAFKPEEYGSYYAWGETQTKNDYSWSTYKWCNGSNDTLTKYCLVNKTDYWDGAGGPDGKTVLDPEDDAAYVNLGGKWRMPTVAEWKELIEACLWEWTSFEGINGYKVYGFGGGSIIFLPAAGRRHEDDSTISLNSYGFYSSSTLNQTDPSEAEKVYFNFSGFGTSIFGVTREVGISIRPVYD